MTKEYECFVYSDHVTTIIGTATQERNGVIRVFNQLQPINGVFYLKAKKNIKKDVP